MLRPEQMRYLTEVLGIESVIRNRGAEPAKPEPYRQGEANAPFVFFFKSVDPRFETGAERELLDKIIVATKVEPGAYAIMQVDSVSFLESFVAENGNRAAVFFSDYQPGAIKKYGDCSVLFTHSLEKLVKEPALKKATWQGLQDLLKGVAP